MTILSPEELYQRHLDREATALDSIHPDGCWYCGRPHPTPDCLERDEEQP